MRIQTVLLLACTLLVPAAEADPDHRSALALRVVDGARGSFRLAGRSVLPAGTAIVVWLGYVPPGAGRASPVAYERGVIGRGGLVDCLLSAPCPAPPGLYCASLAMKACDVPPEIFFKYAGVCHPVACRPIGLPDLNWRPAAIRAREQLRDERRAIIAKMQGVLGRVTCRPRHELTAEERTSLVSWSKRLDSSWAYCEGRPLVLAWAHALAGRLAAGKVVDAMEASSILGRLLYAEGNRHVPDGHWPAELRHGRRPR